MKVKESVAEYAAVNGTAAAAKVFDITRESVRRAVRRANAAKLETAPTPEAFASTDAMLQKLQERFSPAELHSLASGHSLAPSSLPKPNVSFDGEDITVLFVTDTHWGATHSPVHYWRSALAEAEKQGCTMILHAGDVLEGMSNRPDQVYGLTHLGWSAQMDHATNLLAESKIPIFTIDGNHDRYGIKSGGIFAVRDIAARLPNVTFLGSDQGDIVINGTIWRLWHGEDGSSYATSYRLQKLVESWSGGTKAHVLLAGHVHKQAYIFERNVHCVSGGAMCQQSPWMRSKRLSNHDGFHIIRARIRDNQIISFSPTWYAFYGH